MPIKILHIFPPSYKTRFGGQIFTWKYFFSKWDDSEIVHYVLDYDSQQVLPAKDAFNFEYSSVQKMTTRLGRLGWFFTLFKNLHQFAKGYDILHVHVLWWATLLLGPWAKMMGITAIYESVLLDEDTPGGISREQFGHLKIWLLKSYRGIFAISESLAEDYLKFGFCADQMLTLMNSVDQDAFFPVESPVVKARLRKRFNLPEAATLFIFVGSMIERKGVDLLVDAFIEACSQSDKLYLLMIGPRNKHENPSLDEEFVQNLYLNICKSNLQERVLFLGLIQDRRELSELYRASDIFVFPSRNEGLGNVILEAMSSALPVLVSRLPVLEKVVQHCENGFVVSVGSKEQLKDSMLTLACDVDFSRKIGKNAKKYVDTLHSFEAWQRQLTGFYKKLIDRVAF